jgi:O-antigen/teichoic acid export membrane protein
MFKLVEAQQARLATLKRWSLLSGQVAGLQVLVQGVGAVTGLLLIRALPKEEYAWFTLAASMLATLNLLADGGISSALTSIGGRIYQDSSAFSRLLADGRRLALRLGWIGALLATPFFWHLYGRLETPLPTTLWLMGLALVATVPTITTTLLSVASRLHSRAGDVQLAELMGGGARLVLTLALLGLGWMEARLFFTATLLAALAQAGVMKRWTRVYTAPVPAAIGHGREIGSFIRALYGNHLFFCLQGQITTWIIGLLAGVQQLADLGALSRLAVLFAALGAPFAHLVTPALARIQDKAVLRRRFVLTLIVAAGLVAGVLLVAVWLPAPFLWLLGEKYAHLTREMPIALAAQGLALLSGVSWGVIVVRGWVRHAWVTILTTILGYSVGALLFPLDEVWGLLAFNAVSVLPTWFFCLGVIVRQTILAK